MSKKIIFIILICLVIIGLALFLVYRQSMFSKEILRLEIIGPEKVAAGDEVEYTIKYKNNGNFALEKPKLTFYMPDNSLTEDGKLMVVKDLKDVYPGAEDVVKIKTRLLGKEGDLKISKASLSYTPKNLSVRYESDTTFTTKIDTVPLTLDFDIPSKVEKGKDLQYSLNYFSNIDYPLENLSLKIDSVSGFDLKSTNPSSLDNLEWKLQTLNKAQGGRITVSGTVSSSAEQNLKFSASIGMWQGGNFVVIKQTEINAEVIQPLLYISQQVNGSSDYVASPGEVLNYKVSFKNIGSGAFDNLFMIVRLNSPALDMSTIQASGGQAQSNDNMIVWASDRNPQLRHLNSQEEGEVNFSVKVKSDWNNSNQDQDNAVINNEVNISQITQKFSVKINSGLMISQKGYYKNSEIANSGPVPPQVNKETTYTIVWDIKNYFSDAKNVKVKAVLPENVSLTGKLMPQNELSKFSFDSASKEIVWSVGDILAGTGVAGDPVSLSFQVLLKPLLSQKGKVAPIIGAAQISGENQFTNTTITAQDSGIDTSLPDDFSGEDGGVVN
jgi:hypothetical protein